MKNIFSWKIPQLLLFFAFIFLSISFFFTNSFLKNVYAADADITITTFPPLDSGNGPFAITGGSDGNVWFTENQSTLGKITPNGSVTEYPIPTANIMPRGITAGPDGNIWFTETDNISINKIGRITPSGAVTEFNVPQVAGKAAMPNGITKGPDGNLWFTEVDGFGKITPNGIITQYSVLPSGFGTEMVTGPDGNLWMAYSDKIVKSTVNGEITIFSLPEIGDTAYGITAGSDGNVWFTIEASAQNAIGKITPDGVITRYPIPYVDPCDPNYPNRYCNLPYDITTGPDNNMWFVDNFHVWRITPDGVLTPFLIPDNSDGNAGPGMTFGPDNNIWFTIRFTSQIGKVNLAGTLPQTKTPIIFIPGIGGSEFQSNSTFTSNSQPCSGIGSYSYNQGDTVWVNMTPEIILSDMLCGKYLDVLSLQQDGNSSVYPQIGLKGTAVDNAYGQTISFLTQKGYQLNKDLFIFPYDWRKDINGSIGGLDNLMNSVISSTHSQKVDIIAHSMGGLVASKYIQDSSHAAKVDTLVELGTPHAGAPTTITNLLFNSCFKFKGVCAINGNEINNLVQNFPGFFELLPSKLYYQEYPQLFPFIDGRDIDHNGVIGALNYDQFHSLLSNVGKNMNIFSMSESLHNSLDPSYSNTNGVKEYFIAGSGNPTIGQVIDYFGYSGGQATTIKQDAYAINGDDTVPLLSATLNQQNNVYYSKQSHGDLPSGASLQMAVNLLNGQTNLISGIQTSPFSFSGKIIGIYSPAALDAFDDQGNHTGPQSDGTIEQGIPGSSYFEVGEAKFIYLPDGGHYHLATTATAEGTFDLKIKSYIEDQLTQEQSFLNVPQTTNTTTTLNLDDPTLTLQIDTNNDGTVDQTLTSTSILTGDQALDIQPPTTTAQINGIPGQDGWHGQNTNITLNAQDDNSGVLHTYYYFNGEQSVHNYTGPIQLTREGNVKLFYFSLDKAGNTENAKEIDVKVDLTPPGIACSVNPNLLWSPNHKLVSVVATVNVTDTLSGANGFILDNVKSNEPDFGVTTGDLPNDIQGFVFGTASVNGLLRAERADTSSGRIYTLNYHGMDKAGNTANCSTTVSVPHNN